MQLCLCTIFRFTFVVTHTLTVFEYSIYRVEISSMTLSHEKRMTTETELIFSPERTSNSSFHQAFSSKKVIDNCSLIKTKEFQSIIIHSG